MSNKEEDIGGFWKPQHRKKKKLGKYRIIAKPQHFSIGRVKIQCHTETSTLYVKFRAEITRK